MPNDERADFIRAVSRIENVPEDHISPWPGSGEPLTRTVAAFCSPTKGLVTADPTYETAGPRRAISAGADQGGAAEGRL